jgi:CDP-paratose 2-epimerase
MKRPAAHSASVRPVLITGGAGFIGTNLASRLLAAGLPVIIYDNLSRPGVAQNLAWLEQTYPDLVRPVIADIRDRYRLESAVHQAGAIFHFAAQVAVTTSVENPEEDFSINLRGTVQLLECIRTSPRRTPLLFTSTNKVYGDLEDIALECSENRYQPLDSRVLHTGVGEDQPLRFHSPYGCSKGGADQYVLDFTKTYNLPAVVFRMSCIYGPHQFGTEDQGWVAHFLIRALENMPVVLYGDGRQVRDILFVEDLVDAMMLATDRIEELSGRAFNIGGGPDNTISLLELFDLIQRLHGSLPPVRFSNWRRGDQRYYVSDIRRFQAATGWKPKNRVYEGVARLYQWLQHHRRPSQEPVAASAREETIR